jgi:uncharacterized protein
MIKLFTDSDLDGIGCGLIAKLAFGDDAAVTYCSYRNLNERVERFIDNPENKDAKIYITDLAVNEKVEKKLAARNKKSGHIQMVDHHVTAMHFNNYEWGFVKAEYETGKKTCATSLFYEFLLERNLIEQNPALEEFIELVRQYDTWEWEVNDNKVAKRLNDLFFIIGIEQFEGEMLERLKNTGSFSLSEKENFILDIEDKKIERYINAKNRQLVQTFIDDYCVGIVHAESYLSELGNALAKLNPHLDLIAMVNMGTRKIGFRTIYDEVDVSKFAQKYDGGGHPKASGCSLDGDTFSTYVLESFKLDPTKLDAPKNEVNIKESKIGSLYINRNGDKSFVFQDEESGKWFIFHNLQKVDNPFDSYADAERYIKRSHAPGLAFDNEMIKFFSEVLEKSENSIKKKLNESYELVKDKLLTL